MEILDAQSISEGIWEMFVPKGFKLSYLAKFDGRDDPYEHVTSINTQKTIIETSNSPKCKLLSDTFRDATLQWYKGLPPSFHHQLSGASKENCASVHR